MLAVLKGRVALVTGVSRRKGIGFAIAQRLASMGADVFIHSFHLTMPSAIGEPILMAFQH